MLDVSGHLRNYRDEKGFFDASQNIIINCCGYHKEFTEDSKRYRPDGRYDYQIIYVYKGCVHLLDKGKIEKIDSGNIILYKPNERQIYKYKFEDDPEIYWIHFTGYDIENILEQYHIYSKYIGHTPSIKRIFHEIILELQLKKPYFHDIVNSNFIKLLAIFNRTYSLNNKETKSNFAIDELIVLLNQDYNKDWTITKMADFCNLSIYYFSRLFKEHTGTSAMIFLTRLRLNKAKELLMLKDNRISDIAFAVGYSDPLYFSKLFKKYEGISPKKYKKHVLTIQTPFATL